MTEESFPDIAWARTLNYMMLLWWYSVRSSVESMLYPSSLEPGAFGVQIHYAVRPAISASPIYVEELLKYCKGSLQIAQYI